MIQSIVLGSDHGGFELKSSIKDCLLADYSDIRVGDIGVFNTDSVDYPDYAQKVVDEIISGSYEAGIIVCGTGIGVSIKANRNKGIRAAIAFDEYTASMSRAHNDSNILCLGQRTTPLDMALSILRIWLSTPFEGDRHIRRVEKLD